MKSLQRLVIPIIGLLSSVVTSGFAEGHMRNPIAIREYSIISIDSVSHRARVTFIARMEAAGVIIYELYLPTMNDIPAATLIQGARIVADTVAVGDEVRAVWDIA